MEASHRKSSLLGDRGYDENIVLHNALRHAERLYSKRGAMPKDDSEAARRIIRQEYASIMHIAEEMDKVCSSTKTAEHAELRRAYTDVLIEVLDTALLSDEIGRLKGTHSKLLDLDIKLADAFMDKPRIAKSSISLLNKVAAYSEVLSSMFYSPEAMNAPAALHRKLVEMAGEGRDEEYISAFINSVDKILVGANVRYNLGIALRGAEGTRDYKDNIALNRLKSIYEMCNSVE